MYQIIATKMAVPTTGEVTQPIPMAGANAVVVEMTVFSGTMDIVMLQGSNDLENWSDIGDLLSGTTSTITVGAYHLPYNTNSGGSFTGPKTLVGTQYVRLKLTASSAAIVAAGVNTSQQ